jgi:hypothetical protein
MAHQVARRAVQSGVAAVLTGVSDHVDLPTQNELDHIRNRVFGQRRLAPLFILSLYFFTSLFLTLTQHISALLINLR